MSPVSRRWARTPLTQRGLRFSFLAILSIPPGAPFVLMIRRRTRRAERPRWSDAVGADILEVPFSLVGVVPFGREGGTAFFWSRSDGVGSPRDEAPGASFVFRRHR